ncbi:hypothetical protein CTEN210_06366 [Chaetoceros tenuissimus]|uniref:Uncharacterized protein n=1 Tax=Chaetoceros tenuissimus TaxID=426638 RepID=A0AAD3CS83_9STRA|nr:hypothetical protein CTEN210_06366 [Chaetoceros tenuissimus]
MSNTSPAKNQKTPSRNKSNSFENEIISPPRGFNIGNVANSSSTNTASRTSGANNNLEQESSTNSSSTLTHYKYTTPTRESRNPFYKHLQVKYYKVVYKGVIALLQSPNDNSRKSGAYVSYGEIIASTHQLDASSSHLQNNNDILKEQLDQDEHDHENEPSANTILSSSTLPLLSSHNTLPTNTSTQKIIQVDQVLTGGYAIDATSTATSYTHHTPIRSNTQKVSFAQPNKLATPARSSTPTHTPKKSILSPSTPRHTSHHGYIYESRKNVQLLKEISSPPLLCQSGVFYYRITSHTPLPILAGPCEDAPFTQGMVLPHTIQEISLRIGSTFNNGMQDGIVFLRLAHKRGWITDRNFVKSFLDDTPCRKMEIVVKEVTDFVDVMNFGVRDDISLGGTSISSNSISTPLNIVRTRRRPGRRRQDVASTSSISNVGSISTDPRNGMVVSSKTESVTMGDTATNVSQEKESNSQRNAQHQIAEEETTNDENGMSSSNHQSLHSFRPDIFLVRVTAPNGLKILDAPDFQVNHLIHRQQSSSTSSSLASSNYISSQSRKAVSSSTPSAIFHTMNGPSTNKSIHNAASRRDGWVFDENGKHRKLLCGAIFEASKRIESSGKYSPGSGLIKLADNTGWAIIPNQEVLMQEYEHFKHCGGVGIPESEALTAFEEVGNAKLLETKSTRQDEEDILWVRVVKQNGVLVSCLPSKNNADNKSKQSSFEANRLSLRKRNDDDAQSTVTSVFFDPFRSKKVEETNLNSLAKPRPIDEKPTIPCGSCVKVKRWLPLSSKKENNSFVMLNGDKGWIPKTVHGCQYAVDIKQPDIRYGSFWFRVQASNGIKVRIGPSSRSPAIRSQQDKYFQFECGEYLRASEILTIHGHADIDEEVNIDHPSESFAKLFRNRLDTDYNEDNFGRLESLTTRGEWVHVHCNGCLYLEECVTPPCIERNNDGWKYEVTTECGVQITRGPSFSSSESIELLQKNAIVLISEKVKAHDEKVTWLRLKDGRGWIHSSSSDGTEIFIVPCTNSKPFRDASMNNLIFSKLGLRR